MDRYKTGKKVSYVVIAGNIFLAFIKIIIGVLAHSFALMADGFHSISDIASTVIVIIAINISRKPPDDEHPYGHGQAEPIAAKILGIILIFTGAILVIKTGRNYFAGNIQRPGLIGFWVALLSIIVKEIMFRYTYRIGSETENKALQADAWHHRSDAVSSVAAAIGIMGSYLGYPVLDPLAGIIVAFMIIGVGWKIMKEAIGSLMVKSPCEEKLNRIMKIARSVSGVENIADVKAHYNGVDLYIDLKILVDYRISVLDGHQIASRVKFKIMDEFKEAREVLIHVDPMITSCDRNRTRGFI